MRVSDKAIVLSATRFADKRYMLKLYTRGHGLITVAAAAGSSPRSKIRTSAIMPLTGISAEYVFRENKDVQVLTEASVFFSLSLTGAIGRLAVAQFINEILLKCVKEQGQNEALFDLVLDTLERLESDAAHAASLHLYFMSELAGELGFAPQNNFSPEHRYFDCREGTFSSQSFVYPMGLDEKDSALLSAFLASTLEVSVWTLPERQILLDILITYYKLHIPGFHEVKSLQVLREVIG